MPVISFPLQIIDLYCSRCARPFTAERPAVNDLDLHIFLLGEETLCVECLRDDPFYKATYPWTGERGSDSRLPLERGSDFAEDPLAPNASAGVIVLALARFIGGIALALARQWGAWP